MINFVNVSKVFGVDKIALDQINFAIDQGEFVFVTGHSGSGKTTALRLLLREYKPDQGEIIFNDQVLNNLSRRQVAQHRRHIGVVFQDYKLLDDLTVWENIALPLTICRQSKGEIETRISELLKMLHLTGRENDFPSQLSGGEAQRVSLARALSVAPKIIFADEPTGNLDEENGETIVGLLKAINKYGTTVIFATHNLSHLQKNPQAHQIILDCGKLVYDSAPKTVAVSTFVPEDKNQKEITETETKAPENAQSAEIAKEEDSATQEDEKKTKPDKKSKAVKEKKRHSFFGRRNKKDTPAKDKNEAEKSKDDQSEEKEEKKEAQ
ncbi:MAG: ATP-binding cassette domain-containing protein [bacterium]|nr:ATP-binding cassette domain-containing protein [bacterium]